MAVAVVVMVAVVMVAVVVVAVVVAVMAMMAVMTTMMAMAMTAVPATSRRVARGGERRNRQRDRSGSGGEDSTLHFQTTPGLVQSDHRPG